MERYFFRLRTQESHSVLTLPGFALMEASLLGFDNCSYLCFGQTGYRLQVPMTSFRSLINLLEQFTEFRKTFCIPHDQFIIKGCNSGTDGWHWCIGQGMWEGAQTFRTLFGCVHSLSTSTCSPAWKLSEPCTPGISMEVSTHRHGWLLSHLQFLFPSQRMGGVGLKAPSF